MILTKEQLDLYLTNILGIEEWEKLYNEDSVSFLKKIVVKNVTRVYFHNLHIASVPIEERTIPTVEQIIDSNLSGDGGNCLNLNYFMGILLKSIGYDTTTIAGTIAIPNNHVMNIVKISNGAHVSSCEEHGKNSSKLWLVDVGCGQPIPGPIPFDFLPYRHECCDGSFNEFRSIDGNQYGKFLVGGGFFKRVLDEGLSEKLLISFELNPVNYNFFVPTMNQAWKCEETSVFCRNLFLFRHYYTLSNDPTIILTDDQIDQHQSRSDNELVYEFILVFGKAILFGSPKKREVKSFETYEDMIPTISKYFPKLNLEKLEKSIEYLNKMIPINLRW